MSRALNRLAKWKMVYASWQLGTRLDTDPECQAIRDHREATLVLRAEVTALVALLVAKGVFTAQEFVDALDAEAVRLSSDHERKFPGFTATDAGMHIDVQVAQHTMKGWPP